MTVRRRRVCACGPVLAAALFLPLASAASADLPIDWAKAQRVDAVMTNYAFDPGGYDFRRGIAYRLHLENRGTELHEFGAPDFFKAVDLRNPDLLNRDRTEVAVPPGKTRDLYFVARKAGTFRLRCPDHDWAGMVGTITIR